ncbi:MAG: diadenylate cyclase [Rhabdochlamydiaceae bacterium]
MLSFFWKTRSMDLMIGALAFLMVFGITSYLNLPILYTIMKHVANVAAIAVIVIFQPELRLALSKLSFKRNQYKIATDKFLDQLTSSVFRLADKRRGALIVLEHKHNLDEFARKGILLNADFSPELIETIFAYATPLHDGAVLIRNKTILAATVILPLAESSPHLPKDMGTRHLAALGFSQITDAFVIIISEQTGAVSISYLGTLSPKLKEDRFQALFRTVFLPTSRLILKRNSIFGSG